MADLPERYGPPTKIHNGFNRWRKAGVWDRLMDAITKAHDGNVRMCRPVAVPASTRKTGGSKCSIPSLPAARCLPALAATGVHWPARVEPQWNKYAESRLAVIRTPSRPLRLCEPCKGLRKGVDSTCPIGNAITSERNPSSHEADSGRSTLPSSMRAVWALIRTTLVTARLNFLHRNALGM
jgi:hypothetical protein